MVWKLAFYLSSILFTYSVSSCQEIFDLFLKKIYENGMDKVLSIKIDPRMKKAIEDLAEKEFAPVTTIVKKALDKYLQENGLHWRGEDHKRSKK